jgi:hypothetical protein
MAGLPLYYLIFLKRVYKNKSLSHINQLTLKLYQSRAVKIWKLGQNVHAGEIKERNSYLNSSLLIAKL